MGGSKKQTVGYWYKILAHWGLGVGPIDAFLEIRGGEKTAWSGSVTKSSTIAVDAENLWGGEKDQGGIKGDFDIMFGEQDQQPNAYLVQMLGKYTVDTSKWEVDIKDILLGLGSGQIPRPPMKTLEGAHIPAWRGFATVLMKGARYGAMNPYPQQASFKIRKIKKGWDNDPDNTGAGCWYPELASIAMADGKPKDSRMYIALDVSGSMSGTRIATLKTAMKQSLLALADYQAAHGISLSVMLVAFSSSVVGEIARDTIVGQDHDDLVAFIDGLNDGGGTDAVAAYGSAVDYFKTMAQNNVILCLSDGGMSNVPQAQDKLGGLMQTVKMRGVGIETSGSLNDFNNSGEPVPVIRGDDASAMIALIIAALTGGNLIGMNPAHALYYARTHSLIGREPTENMDDASYKEAAATLFAEGFGICTEYDPSRESLSDFESRICNLIGGSVSRDITDGKWHLDLARGGNRVDKDSLPILTDDDILEWHETPRLLSNSANSVQVKWFNPETKEAVVTPPVQALALIDIYGTVSMAVDYPEIPTGNLAGRVAERDLRNSITPTRSFEMVCTPQAKGWRPSTYFRLQAPKRGIADMFCMVGENSSGTLKSGAIRMTAGQDVYTMPETTFVSQQPGIDTGGDRQAGQVEDQKAIEAPYIDILASVPDVLRKDWDDGAGMLLAVAKDPGESQDFSMLVSDGGEYTEEGSSEWTPSLRIFDVTSDNDGLQVGFKTFDEDQLDRVKVGSVGLWDREIVRVDAIDPENHTLTLGRGCADTVPVPHAVGSRVWFYQVAYASDETVYDEGETLQVKLLSRTGSDKLDPDLATAMSVTMQARQIRPYPPGNVKVDNHRAPATASGRVKITWSTRNRESQADQLIDTTQGDVTGYDNLRTGIRALDAAGAELVSREDLGDTTAYLTLDYTGEVTLEVWAIDNTNESLYRHQIVFDYTPPTNAETKIDGTAYTPVDDSTIIDGGDLDGDDDG